MIAGRSVAGRAGGDDIRSLEVVNTNRNVTGLKLAPAGKAEKSPLIKEERGDTVSCWGELLSVTE